MVLNIIKDFGAVAAQSVDIDLHGKATPVETKFGPNVIEGLGMKSDLGGPDAQADLVKQATQTIDFKLS